MNAGGIWAHELGRMAGVEIPVVPMEHQYLITRPIEGVRADFPTLRDPDNLVYVREGGRRARRRRLRAEPRPVARETIRSRATSTTGSCPRSGSGSSRSPTARSG